MVFSSAIMQGHESIVVFLNKVLRILMRPDWKEMKASDSKFNAVFLQREIGPLSAKGRTSGCITLLGTTREAAQLLLSLFAVHQLLLYKYCEPSLDKKMTGRFYFIFLSNLCIYLGPAGY
ncbi:hypothetical protein SLEP1_g54481 [Rubroshorea leprosula]|uniref:Uncharacterized protein n=1 Tax=Rubroshorea leprosula TaxID=152421 RepID=A0AAV5MDL6_9ROSI|nr:hypothetical protein SLEP1_g54481 [Rubroshorea leprosula]